MTTGKTALSIWTQPRPVSRTPRRNTPVAKRSVWVSVRCTYGEAVRFPDEPSEGPCEARSQEGARELRSVSTDRRSLPKAVARVMPQGPVRGERKSCSGCFQSQNARVKNGDAPHIPATTCFSGIWRGWGFRVLSCAAKAAFVSRRGEGARMGGGDAPPSARRLDLRGASREGGSLKPGGGKSPPDRQRRSFVAPGFVVARSAAPSTKNFEEQFSFTSL